MAKKTGIEKVCEDLGVGEVDRPGEAAEQVALPGLVVDGGGGEFDQAADGERRCGPGRRRGSTNRRTKDLVNYLAAMGLEKPSVHLAKAFNMTPRAFLEALGIGINAENLKWAVEQQRHCAVALLPYTDQKMPMAVDLIQRRALDIRIGVETADGRVIEAEGEALEGHLLDVAQRVGNSKG